MTEHEQNIEIMKDLRNKLDSVIDKTDPPSKHPDPKKHLYVSLVKSVIRIGAGGCLIQGNLIFAGGLLIFAEILGIVEELV
jgi:hypothetical protein